jgi:heme/copper-type cytochrome/quinol oxidase subunit 2
MRGFVTVETQEEFTKWFDAEEAKAAEESSDGWN